MASRLNPYLNFPGTARKAMTFYRDVFGGDLEMTTYGDGGMGDVPNPDAIMHAMLETEAGFALMGADAAPGMEHVQGTTISVSLSGDDVDDLRGYWEKLSAGGTVSMPLEPQVWGDEFGMCTDEFGIPWMVNISQPQG